MTIANLGDLRDRLYERVAYVEGVTGVAPPNESAEALTRTPHDLLKEPTGLAVMGGLAARWTRQAFAQERYAQLAVRRLP